MISRPFWLKRIEESWREAPIAWLCGVRRSGKTTLAGSIGPERDIQRLFGFRDMNRFNALFEYLLRQSGGQFEVTKTATALHP